MYPSFSGKVALVTGAGAGIGRATAVAFAKAGAQVIVSDIVAPNAEETVAMIRQAGGQATAVVADVSESAQVQALVNTAKDTYGRLDCAFNNAGIEGTMANTAECSEENWHRTIATNLTGVFLCMKYEIPALLESGGGAIVNMASVAGLVGFANLPAYCASKGGVVQMSKGAALEYAEQGLRINAICPGVIKTEMIDRVTGGDPDTVAAFTAMQPMGRMGKPEEIADVVLWLCSDAASFVTGQAIAADGGLVAR